MSKKIRDDKKCLNCGAYVEYDFCPKCGQKNTESRQKFTHLFTHFISDLVHYESSFWQTVRYLLFFPGKLSVEYMKGKRKTYIDPVKLYIFLSFFAFFLPFLLSHFSPSDSWLNLKIRHEISDKEKDEFRREKAEMDSIWASSRNMSKGEKFGNMISKFVYGIQEDMIYGEEGKKVNKLIESFIDYLPKVMLFYMPVFALLLWVMNNRKKRKYFDAGIFTLHFFSFVLLLWSIYQIVDTFFEMLPKKFSVGGLMIPILLIYITVYFYIANKRFYGGGNVRNFFATVMLVSVNTFFISLTLIIYFFILIIYV